MQIENIKIFDEKPNLKKFFKKHLYEIIDSENEQNFTNITSCKNSPRIKNKKFINFDKKEKILNLVNDSFLSNFSENEDNLKLDFFCSKIFKQNNSIFVNSLKNAHFFFYNDLKKKIKYFLKNDLKKKNRKKNFVVKNKFYLENDSEILIKNIR